MPLPPDTPEVVTFAVTPWRPSDAEEVEALVVLVTSEMGGSLQGRRVDPVDRRNRGGEVWVARSNDASEASGVGAVVGMIAAEDLGADVVMLRDLFVDPSWRGTELAAALLRALIDWAESFGMHMVGLTLAADLDAAHRFFKKRGFVETSTPTDAGLAPTPDGYVSFLRQLRGSPENPETVPFGRMEWTQVQPGLLEKRGSRGGGTSLLLEISAALDPKHVFTTGRRGFVLQGRLTFVFATHESTVEAGEGFIVEPGRAHTLRVEGGGQAVVFVADHVFVDPG